MLVGAKHARDDCLTTLWLNLEKFRISALKI